MRAKITFKEWLLNFYERPYHAKNRGYVYHGVHCAIAVDGGKMGLSDRSGDWAVAPEYDWIVSECNNFWIRKPA